MIALREKATQDKVMEGEEFREKKRRKENETVK